LLYISKSRSNCKFILNDKASLIQIIKPIINFIKLNSSKFFQFLIFDKAINLIKEKKHLNPEGKKEKLKLYKDMKTPYLAGAVQSK